MNPPKRTGPPQRRLLGDARRETVEAAHIAKRRRLAAEPDDDPSDDEPSSQRPTAVSSGALGEDDAAIFADAVFDDEDLEADAVYEQVDLRMQSRRKKQREFNLDRQLKEYRDANPTFAQQFADLKSSLHTLNPDDWAAIPDIGDYSVEKQKFNNFTPVPDSLLESARQENAYVATEQTGGSAAATDLAAIGAGRSTVLGHNLDAAVDATGASSSVVDRDGYLSALSGVHVSNDTEIGDINKARRLLRSVTSTNRTHAPGWIAAARLEETAGKMSVARKLIIQGCRLCARDEEVWLEAARLHPPDIARRIFAQAVKNVPRAVRVWLAAARIEEGKPARRRILRRGLEVVPTSVELWRAAIELEEKSGARILLSRAVECVPNDAGMWVALARLETYDAAKSVLNKARKAIPEDPRLWITEAQLEEVYHGTDSKQVLDVMKNAFKSYSKHDREGLREKWLEEAEVVEKAGHLGTVDAILTNALGLNVPEDEREMRWLADAKRFEDRNCRAMARSTLSHLTRTFPERVRLWRAAVDFERRGEDADRVQKVLSEAVETCPAADALWLMLAKDMWRKGGPEEARRVLKRAFQTNPDCESIWLAAAKVETESGEFERARVILTGAREQASSAKVFMKSALLERQLGERDVELQLLRRGLELHPRAEKLWLMLAQWFERGAQQNGAHEGVDGDITMKDVGKADVDVKKEGLVVVSDDKEVIDSEVRSLWNARSVYAKAVERCPKCIALWIGYCRLEEQGGAIPKARAIVERGREKCQNVAQRDVMWRECVYVEVRDGKRDAARGILSRGLQDCPKSGRLWSLLLALEGRKGQKARSVDAIKACAEDVIVIVEVGKYIWRTGKIDKARTWLRRATEMDGDWGDAWATLLVFERELGDKTGEEGVEKAVEKVQPRHGDLWVSVSKAVGNEQMTIVDILRRVAELVRKESNVTGMYALQ